MPELSKDIKSASTVLLKALKTIDEAHLAHFVRKTVPEIELVKHVRKVGQKNKFLQGQIIT